MANAVANMQLPIGRVPDTCAKLAVFIVPNPSSTSVVAPINLSDAKNNPRVGTVGNCNLCLPSKGYAMINPGCGPA